MMDEEIFEEECKLIVFYGMFEGKVKVFLFVIKIFDALREFRAAVCKVDFWVELKVFMVCVREIMDICDDVDVVKVEVLLCEMWNVKGRMLEVYLL